MGFFCLSSLEWQSLPERGFLLDHTLPHRLPLQTAKGELDTDEQRRTKKDKLTSNSKEHIVFVVCKKCHNFTSFHFLFFSSRPRPHPLPLHLSLSVFRLHLPQESTTQISTATAAFVLTSCDHSGLRLSPSPKVGCVWVAFRPDEHNSTCIYR